MKGGVYSKVFSGESFEKSFALAETAGKMEDIAQQLLGMAGRPKVAKKGTLMIASSLPEG